MTGPSVAAASVHERIYEHAEILSLLPHRGCMLMLRRLTVHGPNSFTGEACWPEEDPFIRAHGHSVVPAALLVEAAAQVAGAGLVAVEQATGVQETRKLGLLAGVRRCEFARPAQAGLPIVFQVLTRLMSPVVAHGQIEVFQHNTALGSLQVLLAMPEDLG